MPRTQAWSDEQLAVALELADAVGLREAARASGIPFGTLGRHSSKRQARLGAGQAKHAKHPPGSETPAPRKEQPPSRVTETRQAIIDRATATIGDEVAQTLLGMTVDLRRVAGKALAQVEGALDEADGKKKKPDPAWVRVLVGVVAQSIEKCQLLAGRPTARQAVEGTVAHHGDLSAVLGDPEALQLARLLYRRQQPGGEGGPADPIEEPGALPAPEAAPN